jgi:hypothetical protein
MIKPGVYVCVCERERDKLPTLIEEAAGLLCRRVGRKWPMSINLKLPKIGGEVAS